MKSAPLPAAEEPPDSTLVEAFISEKILCQEHGSLIHKVLCGQMYLVDQNGYR